MIIELKNLLCKTSVRDVDFFPVIVKLFSENEVSTWKNELI